MDKQKSILLVADDKYMVPLVAQINSVYQNFNRKDIKLYLVHDLSEDNLSIVRPYITKAEKFKPGKWEHVCIPPKKRITLTNFGKYQTDVIEEPHFLYIDTDVIVNRTFSFSYPETLSCDGGVNDLYKDPIVTPVRQSIELMRAFIVQNGGPKEEGNMAKFYCDGLFFANRDWFSNVFLPKFEYCSHNMPEAEVHFLSMGFFEAALGILWYPLETLEQKVLSPFLKGPDRALGEYDLIHYLGSEKPWNHKLGAYPLEADKIWWYNYLAGPIPPMKNVK